jgi:putative transposase
VKKSKFSETEIRSILKEGHGSRSRADVCKKYGISVPTFYVWRAKYGLNEDRAGNAQSTTPEETSFTTSADSSASPINARISSGSPINARIKELEAENQLLKRLFVEMALECEMLKSKGNAVSSAVS